MKQTLARELKTVDTLQELGQSPAATSAIARGRRQLEALAAANEAGWRERAAQIAADRKVTLRDLSPSDAERRLDALVATRNEQIRGPVNLYRPEYRAIWLAQKVNDPNFAMKLKMAQLGRFTGFEALNFVDGRRTLLEIRDLVSAEYGPINPAVVEVLPVSGWRRCGVAGVGTGDRPIAVRPHLLRRRRAWMKCATVSLIALAALGAAAPAFGASRSHRGQDARTVS